MPKIQYTVICMNFSQPHLFCQDKNNLTDCTIVIFSTLYKHCWQCWFLWDHKDANYKEVMIIVIFKVDGKHQLKSAYGNKSKSTSFCFVQKFMGDNENRLLSTAFIHLEGNDTWHLVTCTEVNMLEKHFIILLKDRIVRYYDYQVFLIPVPSACARYHVISRTCLWDK